MFRSRYFYHLIFLNMLANIIVFVPRILLDERRDGALMAIVLAIPLGLVFAIIFTNFMNKFPGKGVPEILKELKMSKVIYIPFLLSMTLLWFSAGTIALLAFTDITMRFINPDIGIIYISILFLSLVIWSSNLPTIKVLDLLEIILVISVPLIIFIFSKAIFNNVISWVDMQEATTYLYHLPSWTSLASATYIFTGYINIFICNRVFKEKIDLRPFIFFAFAGIGVLVTTFFIPIGYFGFDGVGEFNYPWISTTDAIRIEFAFVERVLFIFLLLYIGIALINIIIHWHVGLEILLSVLPEKKKKSKWLNRRLIVLFIFSALYFVLQINTDETTVFHIAEWWLRIRMPAEYGGIAAIMFYVWRKKR